MFTGPFRAKAAVALRGGQLLKVVDNETLGPCSAITDEPVGTVVIDAAPGQPVLVRPLPGVIHEVTASASIEAGTPVEPSTTPGQVQPYTTGTKVGVALSTASGSPLKLRVIGR